MQVNSSPSEPPGKPRGEHLLNMGCYSNLESLEARKYLSRDTYGVLDTAVCDCQGSRVAESEGVWAQTPHLC